VATLTWTGNAHAVKQITTLTVAGTWAANDTYTLTINGKDLVLTIGNGTTTAQVAASIRDMYNATTRIDGTGDNTNTSNAGGQEFGEFCEALAVVYSTSTSVVRIIAHKAGVPITISQTVATAGDGDVTAATAQTATGPNHWNNGDNWDTGSAPVDDDVVVFRDSDIPVKYGLPDGTDLEVTIQVYMSYTGQVGLPRINRENGSKPYIEYRQRYVRLDDGGTGSNIAHRFGIGKEGSGCTLFNLKHITVKCSPIVYNTGAPQVPGTYALNLCCTSATSTLDILSGSVDFSSQDGSTSAFLTVRQAGGNSRGINAVDATNGAIYASGGNMVIGGSSAINIINLPQTSTAIVRVEEQSGTIAGMLANSGIVEYASSATISVMEVAGGTFDARHGTAPFTITSSSITAKGSKYFDPARRVTYTNPMQVSVDISQDVQFGASGADPMLLDFA
jgi:hypothetical protein